MRKVLVFCAIAVIFVSCGKTTTYRLRSVPEGNVMIVEQGKVKGLKVGDTVQLSREVSYPYDYKIEENEATRENIIYTQRYLSGGDTMTAVISKRIARIESIE